MEIFRLKRIGEKGFDEGLVEAWLALRCRLWPGAEGEHREEVRAFVEGRFSREPWAVLVARSAHGAVEGFAEVSVRSFAEGCASTRVGYLEGWYVEEEARRDGVGRALVVEAEAWAREHGCDEMASDADPENLTSIAAHLALGFADGGLVRCFHKTLGDLPPPADG